MVRVTYNSKASFGQNFHILHKLAITNLSLQKCFSIQNPFSDTDNNQRKVTFPFNMSVTSWINLSKNKTTHVIPNPFRIYIIHTNFLYADQEHDKPSYIYFLFLFLFFLAEMLLRNEILVVKHKNSFLPSQG